MGKPKVGFYGLTGCAGDLLNILNCEDEILKLFEVFDIKSFVMASREKDESVELDVAFVEGSVSTEKDLEDLKKIREKSKILIAMGHCAMFGGVQGMYYEDGRWLERYRKVYGDENAVTLSKPLESKPITHFVKVDGFIPGCPIRKEDFLAAAGKLSIGVIPKMKDYPQCTDCKLRENECLLLKGKLCLGPLTRAGCGAICTSFNVPCIGCWGPVDEENVASEFKLLREKGYNVEDIVNRFRIFGGSERAEKIRKLLEEGR